MLNLSRSEPTKKEVLSSLSFSEEKMDEMVAVIREDFGSHSSRGDIRYRIRQGIINFEWPRTLKPVSSGPFDFVDDEPTIGDYIAEQVELLMDEPMDE